MGSQITIIRLDERMEGRMADKKRKKECANQHQILVLLDFSYLEVAVRIIILRCYDSFVVRCRAAASSSSVRDGLKVYLKFG